MDKALAIIHHYGSGVADFVIRATGKMEWNGPGPEPTDEQIEQWESERIAAQAIENQKSELLNLIKVNEYHLISRRFAADVPVWEKKLDEWAAQLEEVKAGKLVEIAGKPVF